MRLVPDLKIASKLPKAGTLVVSRIRLYSTTDDNTGTKVYLPSGESVLTLARDIAGVPGMTGSTTHLLR